MFKYITKRPLFMSGIICCIVGLLTYHSPYLLIFSALIITALIVITLLSNTPIKFLFALILPMLMVLSSICFLNEINQANKLDGIRTASQFTVYEDNKTDGDYNSYYIEIIQSDDLKKGDKLLLYTYDDYLKVGQCYNGTLKLSGIDNSISRRSYYSIGIKLFAQCSNIEAVNRTDIVISSVGKIRAYIKESLFSNMDYDCAATLCALLFGEKSYFTDSFYRNVKAAGVSHVMVVSGMHLAIIVSLFQSFWTKYLYNRKLIAALMLITVITVTALCGFTMSIKRAGVTYIFIALSLIFNKSNIPENALGGAVTIISLVSPLAVLNLSFQLSVLSTFGILSVATPVSRYIKERLHLRSVGEWLCNGILVTLSAVLLTLPVISYLYGEISKLTVLTNLLISFPVTLAMGITIIALGLGLLLPLAMGPMLSISEAITKYINYVINSVETIKNPMLQLPPYSEYWFTLLILFIFWLLLSCKKEKDMVKLKMIREKIISEGGKRLKWR